jgi:hypothetical protein
LAENKVCFSCGIVQTTKIIDPAGGPYLRTGGVMGAFGTHRYMESPSTFAGTQILPCEL